MVPERIRTALALPVVNHRGPEFSDIVQECESHLRTLMGTKNAVMFFAGSGTGMMEGALVNALKPGDKALVLSNGQFSERFAEIGGALDIDIDSIEAPWGEEISPDDVAARLAETDYRTVIGVHNESATGAVSNLAELGAVVRKTPAIFIVDSVSGLGGIEMQQDAWGVDLLVSASQKALMCPPGIGIASISDKAWALIDEEDGKRRFYWDFRKARKASENSQTAFTPPVTLLAGLREGLRMIDEEGIPNVLARHRRLGEALRAGGAALNLSIFTKAPILSDTVTVFNVPKGLHASAIVGNMYKEYGTVIAGARNKLDGTVFRFGTMGALDESDIILDLVHLERTLQDLQVPVDPGSAVSAANAYLRQN